MKFSIVITTYNRLPLLKRAINSALNQTVPCEVVVVDDASDDGTEAYVRSLGDQVTYHRNERNLNHAGSVNAGVNVATGEWIKFLDDDDYLAKNCIEQMTAAISQHPEAVLCSCRIVEVDEQEVELRRRGSIGPSDVFFIPQEAVHYGMLLEQIPIGTPAQVAAQREAFMKTGGWDTSMTTNYDDIDAWIRIAEHGDVLFLQDFLAYRTLWSGSYEKKKGLQYRAALNVTIKERVYKHLNTDYQQTCPDLETISRYVCLHWGLVALQQFKLATALRLCFPVALYPQVWLLFLRLRIARKRFSKPLVPKFPVKMS
ncbi:MAG: glycosyltransferase family 2 protein [Leptolyngbya sp. SIOISBB]|nr:glycosyltransferase family 2 protein [Leptolyngbya sp. SIOISBB]